MYRSRARTGLRAVVVAAVLVTGITAVASEASAARVACTRRAHVGRVVSSAFGPLRCTRVAPGRYRWRPAAPVTPTTTAAASGTAATLVLTTDPWVGEMLVAVNRERAAAGAGPLVLCGRLVTEAQAHAADQAATGVMSHTGSDGSTIKDRADRSGYLVGANGWKIGENVAYGFKEVATVMPAWMASASHRENLLDPAYQHVGFGRAVGATSVFWAQEFGVGGTC